MGRAYTNTGIAFSFGTSSSPSSGTFLEMHRTDNGDRYFLANNGSVSMYGDSSLVKPVFKFDPTENLVINSTLIVGGTLAGTTAGGGWDGVLQVDDSLDATIFSVSVDGVTTKNGHYLSIEGTSTPNAPNVTNGCRLYLDTSGGKTRLMALFESGAAQVVASEP